MKKVIGMSLVLIFAFVLSAKAMSSAVNEDKKAEIEAKKAEKQAEIEAKKEERENAMEEKKAEIEAKKEERIQERCDQVEARIQNRISNLNQNHENRKEAYGQIENKIENLIANLKKQGVDTTSLENKFQEFQTLINSFYSEHDVLMTELNATEDYACGQSEGEFKNQLKEAREQLKIAHNARVKARNYFFQELRPELLQIREQLMQQNGVDSDEETNAETGSTEID